MEVYYQALGFHPASAFAGAGDSTAERSAAERSAERFVMSILQSVVGKYVVVRSYSSGVFAGTIVSAEPSGEGRSRVVIDGSRRLWSWQAKSGVALGGVAANGVDAARSKIDSPINGHVVDDVIEILPASDAAKESIYGAK